MFYFTVYTEEYMIQFLDHLFIGLYKGVVDIDNIGTEVETWILMMFRYLGRYCEPKSYISLLNSAFDGSINPTFA